MLQNVSIKSSSCRSTSTKFSTWSMSLTSRSMSLTKASLTLSRACVSSVLCVSEFCTKYWEIKTNRRKKEQTLCWRPQHACTLHGESVSVTLPVTGTCVSPSRPTESEMYAQNLAYKFKKSYGDLQNRNFEKPYRTTGPWSDLSPDSWSWANSGLETTFGNAETGSFWVTTRGT